MAWHFLNFLAFLVTLPPVSGLLLGLVYGFFLRDMVALAIQVYKNICLWKHAKMQR